MRFERISGLGEEQIDEIESRVAHLLERPWQKEAGRPRGVTLREALVVTCGYLRQNLIEEAWADNLRREPGDDIALHHPSHVTGKTGNSTGTPLPHSGRAGS